MLPGMQGPRWGAALVVALLAILGWGLLVEWTIGPRAPGADAPTPASTGLPSSSASPLGTETRPRSGPAATDSAGDDESGAGTPSHAPDPSAGAAAASRIDPARPNGVGDTPGPRPGAGGRGSTEASGSSPGSEAPPPARGADDDPRPGSAPSSAPAEGEADPAPEPAAPGVLSGRVRAGGAPVQAFSVSVAEAIGALQYTERGARRFTDAAGRFDFPGLPPGLYRVVVIAEGHAPWLQETPLVPGGAPVLDVELAPGGVLTGRVVREDDGAPIPNARVAAEGLHGLARRAQPHLGTTRTDAAGQFRLEGLGDARVAVTVGADGFHTRISPEIEVLAGSVAGPLEIALAARDAGEREKIELAGVGAVLSSVGDTLIVRDVAPDSGAAEVGIAPGDRILRINGQDVTALGFEGSIRAIRGPEGTTVSLAILPQGAPPVVELSVRRGRVRV